MEKRIASSLYDEKFEKFNSTLSLNKKTEPALNVVKLTNNIYTAVNNNHKSKDEWLTISKSAAFFKGFDRILTDIIIMVYEDPDTKKIGSVLFSILGEFCFHSLTIDHKSRFFGACKNLRAEYKDSNVRRSLAVTLLKTYSSLDSELLNKTLKTGHLYEWDETIAGEVASDMQLVTSKTPEQIGTELLDIGFLQSHYIGSTVLDVIYDNRPEVIDSNNKLVYLLGKQLDSLFDPLTEYSPESTPLLYIPPTINRSNDDELVETICKELLQLQENTTTQLVKFLREVVVPIRMKSLTNTAHGLSAPLANQAFPPTIDEITRINCLFLESLTSAAPFGSFEIVKACGTTIPYFYKAIMRHESALRTFADSLRDFLQDYKQLIPDNYSERQIESILKSSINLTKIKLILKRLIETKVWDDSELPQVNYYFKSASETIDSFGKDDLKPYNRRVFTPSGKILTEICEGWPSVLSYGWMNRKVISVFDTQDKQNNEPGIIILFSDYIVFATVEVDDVSSFEQAAFKPQISNILMNSLMNENPIKNIPQLKVTTWTSLSNLEATTYDKNSVQIIIKNECGMVFTLQLEDSAKFVNTLNKAKILSKRSPFHLFKNEKFGFTIYATAHETESYQRETTRSSVVLFLNIELTVDLLEKYSLFAGISAKFVDEDTISVTGLTISGEKFTHTVNASDLSSFLSEEVSCLEGKKHSIQNPEFFRTLSSANKSLILKATSRNKARSLQHQSRVSSAPTRVKSTSSTNSNKPLPRIVDNGPRPISSASVKEQKPKSEKRKLLHRLSSLFSKKNKKAKNTKFQPESKKLETETFASTNKLSANLVKPQSSATPVNGPSRYPASKPSTPETDIFDSDIQEVVSFDDCKTFESSMAPIFTDDIEAEENSRCFGEGNWILTKDNSFIHNRSNFNNNQTKKVEGPRPMIENVTSHDVAQKQTESLHNSIPGYKTPIIETGLPTFNSMDDEFRSPLLKVLVSGSTETLVKSKPDMDDDIFYTPKSLRTAGFDHSDDEDIDSESLQEDLEKLDFGSFDVDIEESSVNYDKNASEQDDSPVKRLTSEFVKYENPLKNELPKETDVPKLTENTEESISPRTLSFKSCSSEKDNWKLADLNFITENKSSPEKGLLNDDSYRYLANIVNGSLQIDSNMQNSDSYMTLPRSYSSLTYLAGYIDNDLAIESDL